MILHTQTKHTHSAMECKIGLALFLIYTTKLYKHLNAGKLSSLSLHSYTPSHKTGLTYPKKCRLFAISRCMYKLYADLVRDLLTELGGTEMYVLDTHTHTLRILSHQRSSNWVDNEPKKECNP